MKKKENGWQLFSICWVTKIENPDSFIAKKIKSKERKGKNRDMMKRNIYIYIYFITSQHFHIKGKDKTG